MENSSSKISADFNFKSHFIEVHGSKILFYAQPGGLITEQTVGWCKEKLPNLTTIDIGPGLHFVQEDNSAKIGEELARWYRVIN